MKYKEGDLIAWPRHGDYGIVLSVTESSTASSQQMGGLGLRQWYTIHWTNEGTEDYPAWAFDTDSEFKLVKRQDR